MDNNSAVVSKAIEEYYPLDLEQLQERLNTIKSTKADYIKKYCNLYSQKTSLSPMEVVLVETYYSDQSTVHVHWEFISKTHPSLFYIIQSQTKLL